MGLDIRTADFLFYCKQEGITLDRTCTLGRQSVKLLPSEKAEIHRCVESGIVDSLYADDFFRSLGATKLSAIDASSYEGADIIYNLNEPPPDLLLNSFDCLVDGGTLEHVFDFPTAYKNCLRLIRPGGHFILCNMANNCMGHGFYQFQTS